MSIPRLLLRVAAEHSTFRQALLRDLQAAQEIKVELKNLPEALQEALKAVGYRRQDVGVQAVDKFRPSDAGNPFEGNRGYLVLVDLVTGKREFLQGSWGGANMFTRTTVDDDRSVNPIPPNHAVIIGESGGRGNFAHVKIHPSNFGSMMLEAPQPLDDKLQTALNSIAGLTSQGRVNEFQRRGLGKYGPENPYVQELAKLGLVKIQGRNVIVTTEGKNRRTNSY